MIGPATNPDLEACSYGLPDKFWNRSFGLLDVTSLGKVVRVSKKFNTMVHDNKSLCYYQALLKKQKPEDLETLSSRTHIVQIHIEKFPENDTPSGAPKEKASTEDNKRALTLEFSRSHSVSLGDTTACKAVKEDSDKELDRDLESQIDENSWGTCFCQNGVTRACAIRWVIIAFGVTMIAVIIWQVVEAKK